MEVETDSRGAIVRGELQGGDTRLRVGKCQEDTYSTEFSCAAKKLTGVLKRYKALQVELI